MIDNLEPQIVAALRARAAQVELPAAGAAGIEAMVERRNRRRTVAAGLAGIILFFGGVAGALGGYLDQPGTVYTETGTLDVASEWASESASELGSDPTDRVNEPLGVIDPSELSQDPAFSSSTANSEATAGGDDDDDDGVGWAEAIEPFGAGWPVIEPTSTKEPTSAPATAVPPTPAATTPPTPTIIPATAVAPATPPPTALSTVAPTAIATAAPTSIAPTPIPATPIPATPIPATSIPATATPVSATPVATVVVATATPVPAITPVDVAPTPSPTPTTEVQLGRAVLQLSWSNGEPISGVVGGIGDRFTTGANGQVTIGAAVGSYTVSVGARGGATWPTMTVRSASNSVTVTSPATHTNIVIASPVPVEVTVVDIDGEPQRAKVLIEGNIDLGVVSGFPLATTNAGSWSYNNATDDAGRALLWPLPDRGRISVVLGDGVPISVQWNGERSQKIVVG